MASAILNPSYLSHSSSTSSTFCKKPIIYASFSTSQISYSKNPSFCSITSIPQLGLSSFPPWNGLKQNGVSISLKSFAFERGRKCKGKGVFASLFGVGAPEALVIGVVALLVFGPKGLAEIAKNLGSTLRAFQPTIRELQDVSREFKSTLEKEIGFDELKNPTQSDYASNMATLSSSPLVDFPAAASATTKDSPATTTPPAAATEDSPATATPSAATTEDSPATAIPSAATMEVSQPMTTLNTDEEVAAGMPPAELSKTDT